jgi:hypothetical protein
VGFKEPRAKKLLNIGANATPSFQVVPIAVVECNLDLMIDVEHCPDAELIYQRLRPVR